MAVDQEPATRKSLKGPRLLRGQRRIGNAWPKGDKKPKARRVLAQRGRDEPGVLAVGSGRSQDGIEPEIVGRTGDLSQVVKSGGAPGPARPGHHVSAVTRCWQEPMQ